MNYNPGDIGDGVGGNYDKDSISGKKVKNIIIGIVCVILFFCVLVYFFE